MRTYKSILLIALSMMVGLSGCKNESTKTQTTQEGVADAKPEPKLFRSVSADQSGIAFRNTIQESDGLNFYTFQYLYNGGGVAVLDVNNDDQPDLYFTGNNVPDKLYLNKGNFKFEDISDKSGISGFKGWKTGVSVVDINQDGNQDIYVCRSGWYDDKDLLSNLLFINQGDGTFKESAKEYGLSDPGHSVQSVFFDYDKDGDLDAYISSHPIQFKQPLGQRLENAKNPAEDVRDKLFRNNGDNTFTDVSKAAGIWNYGHGLGLCVSDLNMDGWPDIYVANDFQTQDYLYMNNGDGTFTSSLENSMKHCSYFSMGCDIADINNDGLPDVYVVEMLAEDNKRQKTNMASMNPDIFWALVDYGFHWQFMRNTLQVNNGNGAFTETAYHSGVFSTDWSWGPLLQDFDNDGDKDLLITNGYLHDTQDKDFVKESNKLAKKFNNQLTFTQVGQIMPQTRLRNYAYENVGDLKFKDKSTDWGFDFKGFSNGIAFADFDNDGDLDVVVNNINDPASVYENLAGDRPDNNYIRFKLEGTAANPSGIGAKVRISNGSEIQYQEMQVVRGFQSSNEDVLHFGLGANTKVDKVEIEWPDGKAQVLNNLEANNEITLKNADADKSTRIAWLDNGQPAFEDITQSSGLDFQHKENDFDDYEKELLLPHKQSQFGPRLVVGDVNGDGKDDIYVGGAKDQAGALYVQGAGGKFSRSSQGALSADSGSEDLGGAFLDADGDGDQDLYVVSGGNDFNPGSTLLQDRLYLNDGSGNFTKAEGALPKMLTSGGCAAAADYDGDGDMDLFVGGRLIPGKYPFNPRSYLLQNDGGKFTDVTARIATDLLSPGLINTAKWTDFDGDGSLDLIVAGEWTNILMFRNNNGSFEDMTETYGLTKTGGWWNALEEGDFDGDGDMDYVLGNLGQNYKYQAKEKEPFHVYCHDFDENGSLDIVLGYYNGGTCFPVRGRQCSSEQMPMIAEKFPTYSDFGSATLEKVYGEALNEALHKEVHTFASVMLKNNGDGFEMVPLPVMAQLAPINGIVVEDFDGDGDQDILGAGNLYVAEVETGRADGGVGTYLANDGSGQMDLVPVRKSGFFAWDDVKDLALLRTGGNSSPIVVVANNNAKVKVFRATGNAPLP